MGRAPSGRKRPSFCAIWRLWKTTSSIAAWADFTAPSASAAVQRRMASFCWLTWALMLSIRSSRSTGAPPRRLSTSSANTIAAPRRKGTRRSRLDWSSGALSVNQPTASEATLRPMVTAAMVATERPAIARMSTPRQSSSSSTESWPATHNEAAMKQLSSTARLALSPCE